MRGMVVAVLMVCAAPGALARQAAAPAQQSEPLFGIGFDDALAGVGGLAPVLPRQPATPWRHPIHVRVIVDRAAVEPTAGQYDFAALRRRLAEYRDHPGVDVYLDIRAAAPQPEALPDWRGFL